ncbi:MAG: hypothetical protein Kow0096_05450 [Thiohalomonadaceae bacterium]
MLSSSLAARMVSLLRPLRERLADLAMPAGQLFRRAPPSLARRILLLQVGWAIAVYLLVSIGLWWGTAHIIEQNLQRQAAGWLAKADEQGTPLFASDEGLMAQSHLEFLRNIPEILSVHYFDASGRKLVHQYWREGAAVSEVPWLTAREMAALRSAEGGDKPILFTKDSQAASFRATAPVWIKSLRRDGLVDFSLDAAAPETVQTIGFITMQLDYGRFNAEFARQALLISVVIALLLLLFMIMGRVIIRWALRPLTSLEAPLVRLANGEIDVEVESSGDREIAQIGRALNTTISALRERDETLRRMANQDPLTGLANRGYFDQALQHEIDVVAQHGGSSALLFIDLDRFKQINDTYGHAAGDRLLMQVAELLRGRMRECDLIARFGGDEFTVLVRGVTRHGATEIAASLIQLMQSFQFHEAGEVLHIYFSIGVAIIDDPACTAHEILLRADAAASEAKRRGRNRFQVYDRDVVVVGEEPGWRKRLQEHLDTDNLLLNFQPVIDLASGAVMCHEVLVRLPDGSGGTIAPAAFMADAERYGMAADIDRQVVRKAIEALAEQPDNMVFSINLSQQTLEDDGFPFYVSQLLQQHKIAPQRLMFEVAEQVLNRHFERVREQLDALAACGAAVVIDDFGAGFASLAYLKRCAASCIKIDGQMMAALKDDKLDQIAIRAIAETAAARGIRTVAKFAPDEQTLALLGRLGIEYAQGNLIAPPEAEVNAVPERRPQRAQQS